MQYPVRFIQNYLLGNNCCLSCISRKKGMFLRYGEALLTWLRVPKSCLSLAVLPLSVPPLPRYMQTRSLRRPAPKLDVF